MPYLAPFDVFSFAQSHWRRGFLQKDFLLFIHTVFRKRQGRKQNAEGERVRKEGRKMLIGWWRRKIKENRATYSNSQ